MIVKAQGCDKDFELLQRGLENLERWRTLNGMEFKVKKPKIIKMSRKKQPFTSIFLLNSELEVVNESKGLGVPTDHHLRWNFYQCELCWCQGK